MNRRLAALLLLVLSLAGCADRDDAIPPALAELHQRASVGDASAQLDLGLHYVTGSGIPPDESAALRWIGNAATQGNAAAQFELDSYYTLEPHRNWQRAAELLRQSAWPRPRRFTAEGNMPLPLFFISCGTRHGLNR